MPWFGWLLWLCLSLVFCWFILLVSRPGWAVDHVMTLPTGVRRVITRFRSVTRTSEPADPQPVLPSSNVRLVPEYELLARESASSDGLDDGTPVSWLAVSQEDVPGLSDTTRE